MNLLERGGVYSTLVRTLGVSSLALAAALAWPRPAAAHEACCRQCVNPHGGTIPPAGSAPACDVGTLPTTNASNAGFNPDGFFQVGTTIGGGACGGEDTTGVKLFNCTSVVVVDGELTCAAVDGQFCIGGDCTGGGVFDSGTLIKFTEANGAKAPTVSPMGSNNGSGNEAGGAVTYRLKASGDLLVCSVENPTSCVVCPVPPPPK
jgi:hypothetical protein